MPKPHRWHTKTRITPADLARKRKYNSAEHKAARRSLAEAVTHGATCWRCGQPPGPTWHVGHDDVHTHLIRGPECADCNRRAGARKGLATVLANRAAALTFIRPHR